MFATAIEGQSAPGALTLPITHRAASLLVLGYLLVPTYLPAFATVDVGSPRFLALALLNVLACLGLLVTSRARLDAAGPFVFAATPVGRACLVLLGLTLLSTTQAINRHESLLHTARLFNVLVAAAVFTWLCRREPSLVRRAAIVLTGMLVVESLLVIRGVMGFVGGSVDSIADIRLGYANKNILAAALFVKTAAAWWLLHAERGWRRGVAAVGMLAGMVAVLLLAARAFQLGLLGAAVLVVGHGLVQRALGWRGDLAIGGAYAALLAVALVAVSSTQAFVLSRVADPAAGEHTARLTAPISSQLASIDPTHGSARLRLQAWRWSLAMIGERPLLGVGAGNWKLHAIAHENRDNPGYVTAIVAHNDVLQTTAETGLGGGLAYLAIYVCVVGGVVAAARGRRRDPDGYQRHLLASCGLLCFGVDAFFNFPHDRPEMMVLFAFFVAVSAAGSAAVSAPAPAGEPPDRRAPRRGPLVAVVVVVAALLVSAWALLCDVRSGRGQRAVYSEIHAGRLQQRADGIMARLPAFPNLSRWGEPRAVIVARYLVNEGRYREAIDLLGADRASPFDARREYMTALSYQRLGEPDSALAWAERAWRLKPYLLENITIAVTVLSSRDDHAGALAYLDRYLAMAPGDVAALVQRAFCHYHFGDLSRCLADLDAAQHGGVRDDPELLNLRGACHEGLGDTAAACRNYAAAAAVGGEAGQNNWRRLCGQE